MNESVIKIVDDENDLRAQQLGGVGAPGWRCCGQLKCLASVVGPCSRVFRRVFPSRL